MNMVYVKGLRRRLRSEDDSGVEEGEYEGRESER